MPTSPSHQLALSNLALTTSNQLDINNQLDNNSKHSDYNISMFPVPSDLLFGSNFHNINIPASTKYQHHTPNAPNKHENLKRNRDRQSPNHSNEKKNTNKNIKTKLKILRKKTLKEYWLDKSNKSNKTNSSKRFELLEKDPEENELHTLSGTELKTKTQIQTEQRKLKLPHIYSDEQKYWHSKILPIYHYFLPTYEVIFNKR